MAQTRWRRTKEPGEPNLYRAGDDYWACATPPGSRQAQWKKIGTVGIMQARRERDAWVAEVREGTATPTRGTTKVRDLIDDFLDRCKERVALDLMSPNTETAYRIALHSHFRDAYGSRAARSMGPNDLVAWHQAQRRTGDSDWSILTRFAAIRGMFALAVRSGHIPVSPVDRLLPDERPRAGESRVRFLNRREMAALLDATGDGYREVVATLMFTGLRASELLGLVWGDIDFDGNAVNVRYQMPRGGKTAEDRTRLKRSAAGKREIIMTDSLATALRKHKLASRWSRNGDLVFTGTDGSAMPYGRLHKTVQAAARRAALDGVSPHTLRHTFASILIYQGRDVTFVARQLGHANPSMTLDVYGHLFEAARQAETARSQFDAEFGSLLG